jgi:hypothetical protein
VCRSLEAAHGEQVSGVAHGLFPDPGIVRHQIIQIPPNRLLLGVAKQLLRHRIPGDDGGVQVDGHHGDRAVDEERLEVLLLATDLLLEHLALGDIVIDGDEPNLFPCQDER